jgi:4a-hydroxytetrahydrobiopterin dehydratase
MSETIGEWRREGESLVRDRELEDFKGAMAWVNRVADAAEESNHHPDIRVMARTIDGLDG